MMEMKISFSPESRLDDVRAMMDSYGVEIWKNGLIYLRSPLFYLMTTFVASHHVRIPTIDSTVDLRLIQSELYTEDGEPHTRWPFYVDHPLMIHLALGDQWWEFVFTPGLLYEDRRLNFA